MHLWLLLQLMWAQCGCRDVSLVRVAEMLVQNLAPTEKKENHLSLCAVFLSTCKVLGMQILGGELTSNERTSRSSSNFIVEVRRIADFLIFPIIIAMKMVLPSAKSLLSPQIFLSSCSKIKGQIRSKSQLAQFHWLQHNWGHLLQLRIWH